MGFVGRLLYGYDSRHNLVWMVKAESNPTRFTMDGLNRMTKRERALTTGATIEDFTASQDTIWGFDKNSRMTLHRDDGPNDTTWTHDALDRTIIQTFPDTKTVLFEHDLAHNVTKTTDPAGTVVNDTFDDVNRNTSRSVTLATGFVGTTSETRTFDELNRMLTNADNDYKLEYEYAVIGLSSFVAKETQSYVGGAALSKTVTKTFDAVGNRLTEIYPAGAALSLTNTYDVINQLATISDGTNTLASFSNIGWRPKVTTYQSGATATRSYTGFRSEVATVHHQTNVPTTILQLDYGYNKVHDRTFERFGAVGSAGDAFLYDKLRRLTNAYMGSTVPTAPTTNPYVTKIDYNYDDDGNRTSVVFTVWGLPAATTAYTTNTLNQYPVVGGTNRTHDASGNLTNDGTSKFVYNYKNLIVEARTAATNMLYASYKYDAEGRRVEKNVVAGKFERYIRSRGREQEGSQKLSGVSGLGARYDMSQVIATYDNSGTWNQNFVWGQRIDQILVVEQADALDYDGDANTAELTRSYYHCNALGSVMEITDANQAAVVSYRYTPYGEVTITRGGVTQGADPLGQYWGYTGRFSDEETALWHFRARYYNGATGRFLQRDPAGFMGGPGPYFPQPTRGTSLFGDSMTSAMAAGVGYDRARAGRSMDASRMLRQIGLSAEGVLEIELQAAGGGGAGGGAAAAAGNRSRNKRYMRRAIVILEGVRKRLKQRLKWHKDRLHGVPMEIRIEDQLKPPADDSEPIAGVLPAGSPTYSLRGLLRTITQMTLDIVKRKRRLANGPIPDDALSGALELAVAQIVNHGTAHMQGPGR